MIIKQKEKLGQLMGLNQTQQSKTVTYTVQSVRSKKKLTAFLLVILKYNLCFEQKKQPVGMKVNV